MDDQENVNEHIAQAIHASCTPREFEMLVASLYEEQGYRVEMKDIGADKGTDFLAHEGGLTHSVQVKRYTIDNKIGSPTVRNVIGSARQHDADGAHIVTTSLYTGPAKDIMRDMQNDRMEIELVDGVELVDRLDDGNVTVDEAGEIVTGSAAAGAGNDLVSELQDHMTKELEKEAKDLQHELIRHLREEIEENYKDQIIAKAKDVSKETARRIKEEDFGERMTQAREKADSVTDGAAERASVATDVARSRAGRVKDAAGEKAGAAKGKAGDAGGAAKNKASDASETAKEKTGEAADAAKDKADDAKEKAKDVKNKFF